MSKDARPRGGTDAPLLAMRAIEKSFVGVKVLYGVDLECRAGEVHAIVGENGAGKSTLMKVLAGAHAPDAGEVLLAGEVVTFRHAREAQEKGVSIIYQEFNLLPERTVAQNVFLGREPHRGPLVDRRKMEEDTAALLRTLDAE
jgi:ABC-type sugar transport system ATPase subunit